jgi:uncharacterized membrane protein YphA (DoxX/SURF4 family)
MTIGIWTLRVLMALLFLSAAAMKLSGAEMEVAAFDQLGLGQWFRYFVAALEVIGGIAVLAPRFSIIGAGVLLFVDIGAFGAQIMVLHQDWIHAVVIAALLVLLIQLQRMKPVAVVGA